MKWTPFGWTVAAILGLALAGSLVLNLFLYIELATNRDGRPAGDTFVLKHDVPVFAGGGPQVAFTLPPGTRLQDSTPKGAATLGKFYGHQFLLVLSQGDETAGRQIDTSLFDFSHSNASNSFPDEYSLRSGTPK